jgi:hypothetical protein
MVESSLLASLIGAGKSAFAQNAKQLAKDWLTDKIRVPRAIRKTAAAFSTELPGAENALKVWIESDAFLSAFERLMIGEVPEQLVDPDEFLRHTGLGFGAAPAGFVAKLLSAFFRNIREDLVSSPKGLSLVDSRLGEALREIQETRTEFATLAASVLTQTRSQNTSAIFNQVARIQGWGIAPGYGTEVHVNLELPPTVQNLARRHNSIETIRNILDGVAWCAIHGGNGTGKTQLSILVAHSFKGRKVWVRLGGELASAGLILESALNRIAARQLNQTVEAWCELVCAALGPDGVIVLDDLPLTPGDTALDEYILALCGACAQSGTRLLSTSVTASSHRMRVLAGNRLSEESIPGFTDGEIRELFQAYGAPEGFLDSPWFQFVVHGGAKRHPMLLVEAARYLQRHNWATDDRNFEALSRGTFAASLDHPTVEQIRRTVPDPTTRDLLYRLKLIRHPFGLEEVRRVSSVMPGISFPLEHFSTLIGLWVQQDGEQEYLVSPLLARLADANISENVQRAIHATLARGILARPRLGPVEVLHAVAHFLDAGDVNSAADLLGAAWFSMLRTPEAPETFGIASIWAGMPLPRQIALEKRIYLRTLQVIVRQRSGKDTRFEIADLERLLAEGEPHNHCQVAISASGGLLGIHVGEHDPSLAIRALTRSIVAARRVPAGIITDPEEVDLQKVLLFALWAIPAWIRTDTQYTEWFAAVRQLSPDEIQEWREIPLAAQGSEVVASGIWGRTVDTQPSASDWERVTLELRELHLWARSAGMTSLATSALRNQIIVIAEHKADLAEADLLARSGMQEFRETPRSLFLLADTIAKQHYLFGVDADAVRWYRTAFIHMDAVTADVQVPSLTLAGLAAESFDRGLARAYLEQSVALSANSAVGALAGVTARGELGILLWNAGSREDFFSVWEGAAQELTTARLETKKWKTLFRIFGNCTGYFLSVGRQISSANADLTVPFPGIFLRELKDINSMHNAEQEWLLPAQMSLLAESVGAYGKACQWARKTRIESGPLAVGTEALLATILIADELSASRMEAIITAAEIGDLDRPRDEPKLLELDEARRVRALALITAQFRLVALTLEIARTVLTDQSSARAMAQTAALLSHQIAGRYPSSRMWHGAAEVFDSFSSSMGWRSQWDKSLAARERGDTALQIMYSVAAIPGAGPAVSLQIQLNIVPWLEQMFSPTLYHATVSRFVEEYWLWAIERFPMNFGLLQRTRTKIAEALQLEDKARVRAILDASAFSVGITLPEDVRRWLAS